VQSQQAYNVVSSETVSLLKFHFVVHDFSLYQPPNVHPVQEGAEGSVTAEFGEISVTEAGSPVTLSVLFALKVTVYDTPSVTHPAKSVIEDVTVSLAKSHFVEQAFSLYQPLNVYPLRTGTAEGAVIFAPSAAVSAEDNEVTVSVPAFASNVTVYVFPAASHPAKSVIEDVTVSLAKSHFVEQAFSLYQPLNVYPFRTGTAEGAVIFTPDSIPVSAEGNEVTVSVPAFALNVTVYVSGFLSLLLNRLHPEKHSTAANKETVLNREIKYLFINTPDKLTHMRDILHLYFNNNTMLYQHYLKFKIFSKLKFVFYDFKYD